MELVIPEQNIAVTNPNKDISIESPQKSALFLPVSQNNLISIQIDGQVVNPGRYNVERGTTLQELYDKAGGLKKSGSGDLSYSSKSFYKGKREKALESVRKKF